MHGHVYYFQPKIFLDRNQVLVQKCINIQKSKDNKFLGGKRNKTVLYFLDSTILPEKAVR